MQHKKSTSERMRLDINRYFDNFEAVINADQLTEFEAFKDNVLQAVGELCDEAQEPIELDNALEVVADQADEDQLIDLLLHQPQLVKRSIAREVATWFGDITVRPADNNQREALIEAITAIIPAYNDQLSQVEGI